MIDLVDKNIALFGANSLTGKSLKPKLIQQGAKVFCHNGKKQSDLLDYSKGYEFIKNCPHIDYAIIMLGYNGNVQLGKLHPAWIHGESIILNFNIMSLCLNQKISKCIVPLTSCGYSESNGSLKEEMYTNGEPHPSIEAHADARRTIYKYGLYLNRQFGNRFVFPVFNNLFGPNARWKEHLRLKVCDNLIQKFCDAAYDEDDIVEAWGDNPHGTYRELLYVDDAADGYIEVLKNYEDYEQCINIGHGIDISIRELAEIIKEESGFRGKIVFNANYPSGVKQKLLDVTKMKNVLKWEPKISLREGIKRTIEAYKQLKGQNYKDLY